ncbi:uncharacterized protein K452DRAFT_304011 [Aplosporella prunicola CBS 121167]|uniref:Uncharacterized protein n=1 Tax=Aplosporella prunicola CBS 121167 TaxID=1176127 RepID=A0A6A6BUU3_9PEZI|nr:uncharacterized protein K452DRAFT_304011 [Aplosporella prunicola CBS 121167]KAF2147123.1 hypothetical protein K452DRAFT_304011 [Aplosporella prunicola CBS 121167]
MQLTNLVTVALASLATALPNPRVGVPASTNATQLSTLPVQPLNVTSPAAPVPATPELAARNTNTTHIKRGAFAPFQLANATHGVFERGSQIVDGAAAPSAGSPVRRSVALPTGFVARRAARAAAAFDDLFMTKRGANVSSEALLARVRRNTHTLANANLTAPVAPVSPPPYKRSNATELPSVVVKRSGSGSGSNSTATFHA